MAWTPILKRPKGLDALPHVLAGPILRQVTPTSVTVWFALRTQAPIWRNQAQESGCHPHITEPADFP